MNLDGMSVAALLAGAGTALYDSVVQASLHLHRMFVDVEVHHLVVDRHQVVANNQSFKELVSLLVPALPMNNTMAVTAVAVTLTAGMVLESLSP